MRSYRFYKASESKVHIIAEFSRCVTYELTVKTLAKALPMEGVVSMDRPASIQKVKNRQKMTDGFRKITGQQVFCPLLTVIETLKGAVYPSSTLLRNDLKSTGTFSP